MIVLQDLVTIRQTVGGFPSRVIIGVPFPFDQVLRLASEGSRVQDVFDFELWLTIDHIRRGSVMQLSGHRILQWRVVFLELRDMDYGVNAGHGPGKLKAIRMSPNLSNDFVWTVVDVLELLSGAIA